MQLVRGVHGFAAQKPGGFVRARLFHDALWTVEGLEQEHQDPIEDASFATASSADKQEPNERAY